MTETGFIAAAYIVTAVALGLYTISLLRRLRREREARPPPEDRAAGESSEGV